MPAKFKVKDARPGCILRWEEVLDAHRGSVKLNVAVVERTHGLNVFTVDGRILWWPTITKHLNFQIETP